MSEQITRENGLIDLQPNIAVQNITTDEAENNNRFSFQLKFSTAFTSVHVGLPGPGSPGLIFTVKRDMSLHRIYWNKINKDWHLIFEFPSGEEAYARFNDGTADKWRAHRYWGEVGFPLPKNTKIYLEGLDGETGAFEITFQFSNGCNFEGCELIKV